MSESPIDEVALILRCRKGEGCDSEVGQALREAGLPHHLAIDRESGRRPGSHPGDLRPRHPCPRSLRPDPPLPELDLPHRLEPGHRSPPPAPLADGLDQRRSGRRTGHAGPRPRRSRLAVPTRSTRHTWLSEKLAKLVDQLPPEYRMVIHLRHREQLSYEEIAQTLEVPLGTVKARLHRAHHRLRALWIGEMPDTGGEDDGPETL